MGREATATCRYKRKTSRGKALLEADELIFRGAFRLVIPYKLVDSVAVQRGRLVVEFDGEKATFEIDDDPAKWADRIANPPTLMTKLGIKSDSLVGVVGLKDDGFLDDLRKTAAAVDEGRLKKGLDIILVAVDDRAKLKKLQRLKGYIKPDGAIWTVRPKGVQEITESDVMAGGKKAGLVDVKVARFSSTHTAEKFVIPKAAR